MLSRTHRTNARPTNCNSSKTRANWNTHWVKQPRKREAAADTHTHAHTKLHINGEKMIWGTTMETVPRCYKQTKHIYSKIAASSKHEKMLKGTPHYFDILSLYLSKKKLSGWIRSKGNSNSTPIAITSSSSNSSHHSQHKQRNDDGVYTRDGRTYTPCFGNVPYFQPSLLGIPTRTIQHWPQTNTQTKFAFDMLWFVVWALFFFFHSFAIFFIIFFPFHSAFF